MEFIPTRSAQVVLHETPPLINICQSRKWEISYAVGRILAKLHASVVL
jgi:hypothetical protein